MGASGRRIWWAAFGVFGLIGVTWALSIAPMGAPDEIAHSRRAVAVARGQIMSETVWADKPTIRLPRTDLEIPFGYGEGNAIGNDLTNCWLIDLQTPASCAPRPASESGPLHRTVTYVGAYQPAYYLVVGLPSRWLAPWPGIHAMRVVSALLVAALLASATVSLVQMDRGPWAVVGFAAALTPTVLFLSGSINPNGVEIAAAVAVWTSVAALLAGRGEVPARLVSRVGIAAVVLACTRPTSPVLLVAIVAVALAFGASRARLVELWASSRVRALVGVVGAALLANVVFVVANDSLSRVILTYEPARTHGEVARQAVERTPGWLDEALGSLAWLGPGAVGLPVFVRWLWWGILAAVTLVGLVRATGRQRAVLLLLVAGCLVGPVVASVLKPQVVWQGRYTLPLLVGIPILAGVAAGRSAPAGHRERWAASVLVAVLAACQVAAHQQLMVRNLLGLPSGLLRGVLNATWNGPLTPLALLAMAGLGSLGFFALCLGAIWRRTSSTPDDGGPEESSEAGPQPTPVLLS